MNMFSSIAKRLLAANVARVNVGLVTFVLRKHMSNSAGRFRDDRNVDVTRSGSLTSYDLRFVRVKTNSSIAMTNLRDVVSSTKVLGADDWLALKQRAVSEWRISEKSFESQMMIACSLDKNYSLGRSLKQFVDRGRSGSAANLVTLAKYMRLCADSGDECDENHIIEAYDELRKRQPVFDTITVADIVHGLCRTSRWKDSLALVDTIRLTSSCVPSVVSEDLALAAFRNGEPDDGWRFLQQSNGNKYVTLTENFFQTFMGLESTDIAQMERMFVVMRESDHIVSEAVTLQIKSWFERTTEEEWRGTVTRVDDKGVCNACGSQLESIRLSDADFQSLRSSFISRVIEGSDVYLKTNPYELEKFRRYVDRTSPYSIVVDGLNVAFNTGKFNPNQTRLAEQLLRTVRQLNRGENSRKMMVLGRHHMSKWSKPIMKEIEELAHVFFLDNNSKDDPFVLYAAMHSGQGTYFVSKDLMRDHRFSLNDTRLEALFNQWQAGNQLYMLTNHSFGQLKFKAPVCHRMAVQSSLSGWHIPYEDGSTRESHEITDSWLCLTRISDKSDLTSLPAATIVPSVKSKARYIRPGLHKPVVT